MRGPSGGAGTRATGLRSTGAPFVPFGRKLPGAGLRSVISACAERRRLARSHRTERPGGPTHRVACSALARHSAGMCGRARLSTDASEIKLIFSIPPHRPTPNFAPTWNLAPTDPLPIVRFDAHRGERSLDVMRWGLVPYWASDIKIGYSTFNAKAEGLDARPAFREPFRRRRCLVPLDGFYEWKKLGDKRQPYAVALADRRLMAVAGLWDSWRSPQGERLRSFTIITTKPNELLAPLHDRMPVILDPRHWPAWLGEEAADPAQLRTLLAPYPADDMAIWPVGPRVGNVKNNDPSLIEPDAAPA